jgi:hypothetical protein
MAAQHLSWARRGSASCRAWLQILILKKKPFSARKIKLFFMHLILPGPSVRPFTYAFELFMHTFRTDLGFTDGSE